MVDKINKFLKKLDGKKFKRTKKIVARITQNDLQDLDIKPLSGSKGVYRCRVGDIRILFTRKSKNSNVIRDIDFRGNIYK